MEEKQRFYYAEVNSDNVCFSVMDTATEMQGDRLIALESYDLSVLGKKYQDGVWQEVEVAAPPVEQPSEEEIIQAQLLLNQMDIINRQNEQDEVLAQLLLNSLEV